MSTTPYVAGHCPMGCGQTLCLHEGAVRCVDPNCSNPHVVSVILADPETDHIVVVDDRRQITVQHPLRERIENDLFECGLLKRLLACGAPHPGRYRARTDTGPSTIPGWQLDRIEGDPDG